jgi:hypothetical protein
MGNSTYNPNQQVQQQGNWANQFAQQQAQQPASYDYQQQRQQMGQQSSQAYQPQRQASAMGAQPMNQWAQSYGQQQAQQPASYGYQQQRQPMGGQQYDYDTRMGQRLAQYQQQPQQQYAPRAPQYFDGSAMQQQPPQMPQWRQPQQMGGWGQPNPWANQFAQQQALQQRGFMPQGNMRWR